MYTLERVKKMKKIWCYYWCFYNSNYKKREEKILHNLIVLYIEPLKNVDDFSSCYSSCLIVLFFFIALIY